MKNDKQERESAAPPVAVRQSMEPKRPLSRQELLALAMNEDIKIGIGPDSSTLTFQSNG